MSECDVTIGGDAKNYVVAHDAIKSHFLGEHARSILRDSVQHLSDFAVRYRVNRFPVAPPVFIAGGSVMMRISVGSHLDPIDREPLRIVNVAVDRIDGATVDRIVRGALPSEPYATVER